MWKLSLLFSPVVATCEIVWGTMQHIPLHPHPVLVILHVTTVTCIVFKNTEHNVTVRVVRHVTNKKSDWVWMWLSAEAAEYQWWCVFVLFNCYLFWQWNVWGLEVKIQKICIYYCLFITVEAINNLAVCFCMVLRFPLPIIHILSSLHTPLWFYNHQPTIV